MDRSVIPLRRSITSSAPGYAEGIGVRRWREVRVISNKIFSGNQGSHQFVCEVVLVTGDIFCYNRLYFEV